MGQGGRAAARPGDRPGGSARRSASRCRAAGRAGRPARSPTRGSCSWCLHRSGRTVASSCHGPPRTGRVGPERLVRAGAHGVQRLVGPCNTAAVDRYGITVPFDDVTLAEHGAWYQRLDELGYTDVWTGEANSADGFTPLALAAVASARLHLGTAVVPVYTRGPGLLAMQAATLAELAPGRFALGVGSSSDVIVERWNATPFVEPYKRVRDTVRFLRAALTGEKVDADYETFTVRGFRLGRRLDAAAADLRRRASPRHAAAGGTRGGRGHHQLAVGRRRVEGRPRGRGGQGHRGPHLRVPDRGRRAGPLRRAAWASPPTSTWRSTRRSTSGSAEARCSRPCGPRGGPGTARRPWPPSPTRSSTPSSSTARPRSAERTCSATWTTA